MLVYAPISLTTKKLVLQFKIGAFLCVVLHIAPKLIKFIIFGCVIPLIRLQRYVHVFILCLLKYADVEFPRFSKSVAFVNP